MLSHLTQVRRRLAFAALMVAIAGGGAAPPPAPLRPGDKFPPDRFSNFNAQAGGRAEIDLAQWVGKKPFILYYWIPGHRRSEETFQALEKLVGELGGAERIALLGVAVARPDLSEDKIRERLAVLEIRAPVLDDAGFRIGQRLQVSSVPNVTIVDGTGTLRLSNGASLSQVLGYRMDVAQAIRSTAETGQLLTYGYLDRYFPVKELEGRRCPDFTAPQLTDSVERRWHNLLDGSKVNVLIFWSVDCPHCRKSLPEINSWLKANPEGVNIVSCASVTSEAAKSKTREFCDSNGFNFTTLVDSGAKIGELYNVTSTPTIVIIGPDGVVDSAIVSDQTDFGRRIEEKKRKLLKAAGTSG